MRGVSTVMDVTLFVLLVGVAIATVVGTTPPDPATRPVGAADEASVLATTTASVSYELGTGREDGGDRPEPARRTRRTQGTLASLLADATVVGVRDDQGRLVPGTSPYREAVRDRVRGRLSGPDRRVGVRAVWQPYPNASLRATTRVGDRPPTGAATSASTVRVVTPFAPVDTADGPWTFDRLGNAVGRSIVDGLFPPAATRLGLRGDAPVDRRTAYRYRRFARANGVPVSVSARTDVGRQNRKIARAMGDRIATDLRRNYDSPAAAAENVSVDRVRIVVRTWSA